MNTAKLFGTNGIRGLVNTELTPLMVLKIGLAIGTFFDNKNLLVGCDARTSGEMFSNCVISGLMATGCNVFFAGMASTPALQYSIKNHLMDGGVIITASHNPAEYNGIKVIWNDGIEISNTQEKQIEEIYFSNNFILAEWNNLGELNYLLNVNDEYIDAIKQHLDTSKIKERKYHVVIDAANSVGGLATPILLRDLGCKITSINANIDGTFPGRMPEPRPENLDVLSKIVKVIGADLGVAFDGDADRAIFVDETGNILMGDITFALIIKQFLLNKPNSQVVTPVSSSTLIKDVVDAYKGELILTRVGSVTVSQKMKEIKAEIGGEENGGVFYGAHQIVRDGAMTVSLLLNIMANSRKKLSDMVNELPKYFIEKAKIECPEGKKQVLLRKLVEQFQGENFNTLDGIKIWFEDKSAILLRPSGTEPIFRLYAEAKSSQRAKQLINTYTLKLVKTLETI